MKIKRSYWLLCLFLAAFAAVGISSAEAPVEKAALPEAGAAPVLETEKLSEQATVYQTMVFLRCGHNVSRRTQPAEEVRGEGFGAVRQYYDVWNILTLEKEKIEMERQIDLYCPMHKVISMDETGQIILSENRYGDGMAVIRIYEGGGEEISGEIRETLIAGQGFDTEEAAEKWLEEMSILK